MAGAGALIRSTPADRQVIESPKCAHEHSQRPSRHVRPSVVPMIVIVSIIVGAAIRAWLLFHDHISSDQAVAGLIARQILHGHTYAFFWGQPFGGVEPYFVAAVFAVFGQGGITLGLAPALLSAVAAVLVWRIALRLVRDRSLAALAGALAWVVPLPVLYQSTVEGGYRGVTLACGLATVLCCLRILDRRVGFREFIVLGLVAGLGWWSLPEIIYFFIPGGLLLIGAIAVSPVENGLSWWAKKIGVAVASFCVAALPWIWANVQSGLASVDPSKFPGSSSPLNPGFGGRVRIFFEYSLPLQLNLRRLTTGIWITGNAGRGTLHRVALVVLVVVVLAVIVVAIVLCFMRGGRSIVIGIALVLFPFLVAAQPGTWYWEDGRYTVYLGALLSLALVVAAQEVVERFVRYRNDGTLRDRDAHRGSLALLSVVVVVSVLLTLVGFHQSFAVGPSSYFDNWGGPDQTTNATISNLERLGIETGYADYWVAYKLDFLSQGRLAITVAGADPDRWKGLDDEVRASKHPAWLFIPPERIARAEDQFSATPDIVAASPDIRGPGGQDEASFIAMLDRMGIPYRIANAGVIQAVIPERHLSPSSPGPPS
jgi:Dolichyl-phosphate-mannose-protein mannosyltransferase